MFNIYAIITYKNRVFKVKAENLEEALNSYIEQTLGFDVNFNMKREPWIKINQLVKPIDTKISFLNELCKIPANRISQIILESTSHPFEGYGTTYELSDDVTYAVVTGCDKTQDVIVIAETYDGLPVTTIGAQAFLNSNLSSIIIPDSITTLREQVFYNCAKLKTVEIPDSITSIGYSAFSGCTSLANLTIPDSVNELGQYALYNCNQLNSITLSNNITNIGMKTFFGCTSLVYITIPSSVTHISTEAFSGCNSLPSIIIPKSVTSIDAAALKGCRSLESITLPFVGASANGTSNTHFGYIFGATEAKNNNSFMAFIRKVVITPPCTRIHTQAFYGCTSIENITIPSSVTNIEWEAFKGCTGLRSITLPFIGAAQDGTSDTHFGYIFGANSYSETSTHVPDVLTNVEITAPCRKIDSSAFRNCANIESIIIPKSVKSIGKYAFQGCTALQKIEIPSSISTIPNDLFKGCTSLQEVTLPTSITTIESGAFDSCSNLKKINYYGTAAQWKSKISIQSDNRYLNTVEINYNYVPLT